MFFLAGRSSNTTLLLSILILLVLSSPSTSHAKSLNFVAFGDFGESSERVTDSSQSILSDQLKVAKAIALFQSRENGKKFHYGLGLGDNFYPSGVFGVHDRQFKDKFVDVYSNLAIPFYLCLGNHDYGSKRMQDSYGNYLAQISFTKSPENPIVPTNLPKSFLTAVTPAWMIKPEKAGSSNALRPFYQEKKLWNMPSRFYQKRFEQDVELFVLDTSPSQVGHINFLKQDPNEEFSKLAKENDINWEKQLIDLDEKLKKSKSKWTLVMGHHPIISDGKNNDSPELMGLGRDKNVLHLRRILCENKVSAYLSGHEHSLQLLPIKCSRYHKGLSPIPQIVSGAAGNQKMVKRFYEKRGVFQSTNLGFVGLEFSKEVFKLGFYELTYTGGLLETYFDLSHGYPDIGE